MKQYLKTLGFAVALALPTLAIANPFCADLGHKDELPAKYAKRGPFLVDPQSGWIVGSDQLKGNFEVTDEARALWAEIKAAFSAKGVTLTALIAPPRPLFAPDAALPEEFDRKEMKRKFTNYITAINNAGIIAPDLSSVDLAQEYYFARDTHWTPKGAAMSAAHLGKAVLGTNVKTTFSAIPFSQTYVEKGSLSTVVEKTCGQRPEAETVASPVYTKKGDALALLADTTDQAIALVGTSFSDRYKRDAYQVAGAVSNALDSSVDNFSTTGGGLVGAMETFILSGALESGRYQTVVWEAPYTAPLTHVSGLRQILGALQNSGDQTRVFSGDVSSGWNPVKQAFSTLDFQAIRFETPNVDQGKLELELYANDGEKLRVKLVKSNRIDAGDRSDIWTMSLASLPIEEVARFKVKIKGGAENVVISLLK